MLKFRDVFGRWEKGRLSELEAAEVLGVTERTFRRWRRRLYKLAADQGNSRGRGRLAFLYFEGRGGLPKNEREATRLYKLAVDQGHASAQVSLGLLYEQGSGGLRKEDREARQTVKESLKARGCQL
jgi:TPR repeat protein